jgi:hypothetical protein
MITSINSTWVLMSKGRTWASLRIIKSYNYLAEETIKGITHILIKLGKR